MTILNSARARDVSLISAQQLLTWLEGRNSSSFGNVQWWTSSMELDLPDQELRFSITVGAGADNLFVIIPNQGRDRQLKLITINDTPVSFEVQTIKGRSYAVFRAATGTAKLIYSP